MMEHDKVRKKEYIHVCVTRYPCCTMEKKNFFFKLTDINHTNVFLGQSPKATEIKAKINLRDLIKLTSFLHNKGNQKENKKTTYRIGENNFK